MIAIKEIFQKNKDKGKNKRRTDKITWDNEG